MVQPKVNETLQRGIHEAVKNKLLDRLNGMAQRMLKASPSSTIHILSYGLNIFKRFLVLLTLVWSDRDWTKFGFSVHCQSNHTTVTSTKFPPIPTVKWSSYTLLDKLPRQCQDSQYLGWHPLWPRIFSSSNEGMEYKYTFSEFCDQNFPKKILYFGAMLWKFQVPERERISYNCFLVNSFHVVLRTYADVYAPGMFLMVQCWHSAIKN